MISGIYMLAVLCLTAGLTTLALVNYFMWQEDFKTHRSLFENTATAPFSWFFGASPWFFILVIFGNFCGVILACLGLWLAFSPDLEHVRSDEKEIKKSAWTAFQDGATNTKTLRAVMETHYPQALLSNSNRPSYVPN